MRKKLLLGRTAAFVMAAAIAAGNTVPVQAKGAGEQRREAENLADGKKTHEDKESFPKASPSEPEEERPEEEEPEEGRPEEEEPERPDSGQDPDQESEQGEKPGEDDPEEEDEEAEEELEEIPETLSSATGDLWEEWHGAKTDWEGEGTRKNPYKITNLSELMGLSESVSQGESFAGVYFELQSDIHLGDLETNHGSWNPIGWFQNKTDLGGEPHTAFEGSFDGAEHRISGLKFTKNDENYSYLGLFGLIKNGTVENLELEAEEIAGDDNVALLAGCVEGSSVIRNVTVNGSVYAEQDAGGIAGEVTGGTNRAVIENCTADSITVNSEGRTGFTGGIAGNVQKAQLADVAVVTQDGDTQDGDSSRIQGKGYVGGVAGRQNQADIYNSSVSGTIGGNGSRAAGGVTGLYESGNLIVSRFDGEIGRTGQGTAAHEGTFIGTREPKNGFTYGTGKNDQVSYLFAGTAAQAKKAIGSSIADDNAWTYDAHIGYFTDYQRRYALVRGTGEQDGGERFFYEELEDGIQHIITQKLGEKLDELTKKRLFHLDHYAPGNSGEPVRGYLVSIPRIDTKNANGTFDNDVAVLTAISSTNNSYYRQIDKDHPSAVAPGCTVTAATAPKNQNGNRYQLVYDENEPGQTKPPTFTDEEGERRPMAYVNGGSYSFQMPEANTELNAEYVKVTTELAMTPKETVISVIQTRTGDRKQPQIMTEVKDQEGRLIAKYLNGSENSEVQVLPVRIHAEHNGQGSAADRTVQWSIDNQDLLNFEEGWTEGYTQKDARVLPNINSKFIQEIILRETKNQADSGYQEAIKNTVYTDTAVVTASTNPATSADNQAVTGTCRVNVSFQIVDRTTVRVEQMELNQSNLAFHVTRRLTGDRKNPEETYTADAPYYLDASLKPSQPFFKNVSWKTREGQKILSLKPSGQNEQSCQVSVVFDENGVSHPAWIQNIVNQDNSRKEASGGYLRLSGTGGVQEMITATSEDQTHGVVSADCRVNVLFQTEDETVIHPEAVLLDKNELDYDLSFQFAGDTRSEIIKKEGFGIRDTLKASVLPQLEDREEYEPYNRKVLWNSSEPDAVSVKDGVLSVNDKAAWIEEALKSSPYSADKEVVITARTEDGGKETSCRIKLHFQAKAVQADREEEQFDIVLTKSGPRSNPSFTWKGTDGKQMKAELYPERKGEKPIWKSGDSAVLTVTSDGLAAPKTADSAGNAEAEWIKNAMKTYPYSGETRTFLEVSDPEGVSKDRILVRLTFKMFDRTYASGGGSSSGSGGGSSSGSGGGSASGPGGSSGLKGVSGPAGESAGVSGQAEGISGQWTCTPEGFWTFEAGRTYKNEWAYIKNPYAAEGQNQADWFRFDEEGRMVTGWFTDTDGNEYYLWPESDGTKGHMTVGWQWIDRDQDGARECYYFNPVSDGTKGKLIKSPEVPEGYQVNDQGAWMINGTVQTKGQRQE
ncbi:uncharacterized protein BN593_02257 [Clostridium sp. CAG:299]|nr:uncharacterized protein BN593_02257 [Clostridium sp. CAG:299]